MSLGLTLLLITFFTSKAQPVNTAYAYGGFMQQTSYFSCSVACGQDKSIDAINRIEILYDISFDGQESWYISNLDVTLDSYIYLTNNNSNTFFSHVSCNRLIDGYYATQNTFNSDFIEDNLKVTYWFDDTYQEFNAQIMWNDSVAAYTTLELDNSYVFGYDYYYDIYFDCDLMHEQIEQSIGSYLYGTFDFDDRYDDGYQKGYADGYNNALDSGSTAATIFTGILSVGLLPINVFLQMLNFEVFGINIGGFVAGLLTIAIIVIILRLVLGGKSKDD